MAFLAILRDDPIAVMVILAGMTLLYGYLAGAIPWHDRTAHILTKRRKPLEWEERDTHADTDADAYPKEGGN
jgi:hypothetical protein